jgi:probable O-glycosylation ligase (exosortase A-associated)
VRELLLTGIVGVLCLGALFSPRIGVFSYIWFSLMRPDILSWSVGKPFSLALGIAALVGCIRVVPRFTRLIRSPITCGLLLLMVPIGLSVVYAIDPRLSIYPMNEYGTIVLMALLIPVVVQNLNDLKWLLAIMAVSIGAVGCKYAFSALSVGGLRFNDGIGGFMSDNNTMATGLAMAVPLCWYVSRTVDSRWIRAAALILMVGSLSTIVMTHSRGGALATASVLLLISLRNKKRFLTLTLLLLLAFPALWLVRDTYFDRLATLEDVQSETSAQSRVLLAKAAVRIWQDYPFLGVGFGSSNEQAILANYLQPGEEHWGTAVIHNTYLQMLVDSGSFAFLIYLALLFGAIVWLSVSARRMKRTRPGLELYPWAIQAGLVAFAVGSLSLSQVRFDFLYMLLTTAAAWYLIERSLLQDSPEPAIETAGQPALDFA